MAAEQAPEAEEQTTTGDRAEQSAGLLANLRIVSLCTLLSRIFGLCRDIAMANLFGAGSVMDAFSLAFRIPNAARKLFGEGALTAAFLPVLVGTLTDSGQDRARSVATAVFVGLAALLVVLTILGLIPLLLALLYVPMGSDLRLLLELTAILAPYIILICLTAQICAVLHAIREFFWPAFLPVLLNLIWIAAVAVASRWSTDARQQIHLISWWIILAGVIQLAIAAIVQNRRGLPHSPQWRQSVPELRRVTLAVLPVIVGVGIAQLNAIIDSVIAWAVSAPEGSPSNGARIAGLPALVESGTAAALYFAQRMYQFPMGVFGVALGTVLFPRLSEHIQRGQVSAARDDINFGIRMSLAIGLPCSVGLMLLALPITRLLFEHGQFNAADARLTSHMIAAYGPAVWSTITLLIAQRGFYAAGDRITPMNIGLLAVVANVLLSVVLVVTAGGVGLAIATTTSLTIQAVHTTLRLQRDLGRFDWRHVLVTFLRTAVATAIMSAAVLAMLWLFPTGDAFDDRFMSVVLPTLTGAAAFMGAARLIGLDEPWYLLRRDDSQ
ncbi:Lipid II flippase MurJ [Maioricimonas rarisocia]|uniref:Probable lipid II flippase MurJ n=1 Tax=Maioricimonas rarisocia TaxID=2528026 RepID=A0A517ZE71_9PLAN|nr:murein biosynthesis integral membrane protein MurJ [Maioricimonas rarisocia]QDU40782.1 Lipid II flippase MurJ [Maioricimonas rarisocia]